MSKLVRDKIPEIIEKNDGFIPPSHIASKEEFIQALHTKLHEELEELENAPDIPYAVYDGIVDMLEILITLGKEYGYEESHLESIRLEKREKRGWFTKGIILEKW